jgi:carbonic anhydrase/acetyltransferase-like protein (isoleucine patch superfamily)
VTAAVGGPPNPGPRAPRLVRSGGAFVADNATICGDVTLGAESSVWYGTIVRADVAKIRIGARTNVQDLSLVHPQHDEDVVVGEDVTIGHGVMVHCRTIGDRCLIGIGAILLAGAQIGAESLIAAGALVPTGRVIPPRSVVIGSPGKIVRQVTDADLAVFRENIARYLELARRHAGG